MKKVTIKRNKEIRLNGGIFVKAHLGTTTMKGFNGAFINHFEGTCYEKDALNNKYYLNFGSRDNKFCAYYVFFKTLKDVRKFIQDNY